MGVPDGIEGVRLTLAQMARIVREYRHRPEITEYARAIVRHVPPKDFAGETLAVFDWVRDNVRYTSDPNGVERIQTPDYTLRERQGDCDDMAILLATLLESVGVQSRFVAVGFAPDSLEHVYVEALPLDAADWVALDPTEPEPAGWSPPYPMTRIIQGT